MRIGDSREETTANILRLSTDVGYRDLSNDPPAFGSKPGAAICLSFVNDATAVPGSGFCIVGRLR